MSALVEIPSATALHIPTPGASPLPLSSGTLTLTLLPANPPTHPSTTITLTIGAASFPLLPNSPVQRVQSKEEHARYIFSPVPADGGAPIGQVKIIFQGSKSQEEWEATEAKTASFEQVLKEHHLWEAKTLFVDDEFETAGKGPAQGWGEMIAGAVTGAGTALASKLNAFTDKHVATTDPTHPAPPSGETIATAAIANVRTGQMAVKADEGATKLGEYVHEGGKKLGEQLPDSVTDLIKTPPEEEKGDVRKAAEAGWAQLTLAAKGVATAAGTVAGSVSENAHRAVEHNFGKPADKVAQDIGQAGANVGSTALSAGVATSAIFHGSQAASGVAEAKAAK